MRPDVLTCSKSRTLSEKEKNGSFSGPAELFAFSQSPRKAVWAQKVLTLLLLAPPFLTSSPRALTSIDFMSQGHSI